MSRTKGRALWLPDVLKDAGLKVEVVPGWEARGKEPKEWVAQVNHHTASNRRSPRPALGIVTNGRPDVPGPLANTLPDRNGIIVVVASGAANHPGVSWIPHKGGISTGVKYWTIGHEIELDGVGEPFPVNGRQYEAVSIMNAAICTYLGHVPLHDLTTHEVIARPRGRKVDPRPYDLPDAQRRVAARMTGRKPAPAPPGPAPKPASTVLRRGDSGPAVRAWQSDYLVKLGEMRAADVDGDFGPQTEGATKRVQRRAGVLDDGIVGDKTRAAALKLIAALKPTPISKPTPTPSPKKDWFTMATEAQLEAVIKRVVDTKLNSIATDAREARSNSMIAVADARKSTAEAVAARGHARATEMLATACLRKLNNGSIPTETATEVRKILAQVNRDVAKILEQTTDPTLPPK
jgi:peptidoglycan hydrolase-like protein with peptidoglycan-binding domain